MFSAFPMPRHASPRRPARLAWSLLLSVVVVACFATWLASSAQAATQNTISDHGALVDYRTYVSRLVSNMPRARSAAQTYANKLTCAGVLDNTKLSSTDQQTLYDEIYADVNLRLLSVNAGPLARLTAALAKNASTWDDTSENIIIAKFERAESAMLALKTSALCADARSFAGSPNKTPAATRRFWKRFLATNTTAGQSLSAFVSGVLVKNEAKGDLQLITASNTLTKRYQNQFKAAAASITDQIWLKLGLPGS